jgi:ABC-type multidrug transport system ATPase subunit
VTKRYGAGRALDDVSVSIAEGALVRLAGANGAGKSTLLRVLGSLARPTRGSVRVFGRALFSSEGAAARARIGFLGPEAALYGELSVFENLTFCARLRGLDDAAARAAAAELELGAVLDQRVRTLSQGYRRRAGLARALLGAPELLLLDEPWNGLDAEAASRLTALLVHLRARRATVLVATHAAAGPMPDFDRVLQLEAGRLVSA